MWSASLRADSSIASDMDTTRTLAHPTSSLIFSDISSPIFQHSQRLAKTCPAFPWKFSIPFGPQERAKVAWLAEKIYPHAQALNSRGLKKRSEVAIEVACEGLTEDEAAEVEERVVEERVVEEIMMGHGERGPMGWRKWLRGGGGCCRG